MTKIQGLVQLLAPVGALLVSLGAVLGAASPRGAWVSIVTLGAGALALVAFARYRAPNWTSPRLTPQRLYMLTVAAIAAPLLLGIAIQPNTAPLAALGAGVLLAMDLVIGRLVRVEGAPRFVPYGAAIALAVAAIVRDGNIGQGVATTAQGLLIGMVVMALAAAIFRLLSRVGVDA